MVPQVYDWTCSACSLDWVIKSAGLAQGSGDIYVDRFATTLSIGYPNNINPTYGLMDASGSALMDVLGSFDQPSQQAWLDFDTVYALAQETTGLMSGANWYHWVALRGVMGDCIHIANSAPGYKGVSDILSREDFNRLGGFSVIWLSI